MENNLITVEFSLATSAKGSLISDNVVIDISNCKDENEINERIESEYAEWVFAQNRGGWEILS